MFQFSHNLFVAKQTSTRRIPATPLTEHKFACDPKKLKPGQHAECPNCGLVVTRTKSYYTLKSRSVNSMVDIEAEFKLPKCV